MVLATDEVYTYAIFNYINLVWSSHTEAGGKVPYIVDCCRIGILAFPISSSLKFDVKSETP